jgi:tRNA dimethylallyltransferase
MPERAPWSVIAVVGPTATGKTRLAEDLAIAHGGEVVTADSMQVYRGMDIGTAKFPAEKRRVPHHCIDLVAPGDPYSAALYQRDARSVIDGLLARRRTPILAGGTGLYVRAALDEMSFPAGELASDLRARLEAEAGAQGPQAMHDRLAELDPASAGLIHPHNVRRTIRALEMAEQGGSYAEQAAGFSTRESHYETLYVGIELERTELYSRIDARVDQMLSEGLLDEVAVLLEEGYRDALTAAQAIGYKEFVPVVEKGTDVDVATAAVKQASRRYAKRQLTWFRRDPRVRWISADGMSSADIASAAETLVESSARTDL